MYLSVCLFQLFISLYFFVFINLPVRLFPFFLVPYIYISYLFPSLTIYIYTLSPTLTLYICFFYLSICLSLTYPLRWLSLALTRFALSVYIPLYIPIYPIKPNILMYLLGWNWLWPFISSYFFRYFFLSSHPLSIYTCQVVSDPDPVVRETVLEGLAAIKFCTVSDIQVCVLWLCVCACVCVYK